MSTPLFDALPTVAARLQTAARVLLFLDYDGTLTPLVAHPDLALLSPSVRELLQALCALPGLQVVVLSGRGLEDVRNKVRLDTVIYSGNHGLEIQGGGLSFLHPAALKCRAALADFCPQLAVRLRRFPGAWIEPKRLTAAVHVRQTPREFHAAVEALTREQTAGSLFHVVPGSLVFDVRPAVAWHKGRAAAWIREQLEAVDAFPLAAGDDTTDEDFFVTLTDGVTIKVGLPGDTAARYHVDAPADVERFLGWLRDVWSARL